MQNALAGEKFVMQRGFGGIIFFGLRVIKNRRKGVYSSDDFVEGVGAHGCHGAGEAGAGVEVYRRMGEAGGGEVVENLHAGDDEAAYDGAVAPA